MNAERTFAIVLGGALAAAILWRMTPPGAAPADTLGAGAKAASDMVGVSALAPLLPADRVVGMSFAPEDGDAGPVWYTVAYPGQRPAMPGIPSATK